MTVLNYEIHENLADLHVLLGKIKDFAVAQGWTNVFYNAGQSWASQGGGLYDFDPDGESFLILKSTGFGLQDLQYRFRTQNTGTIATHEWMDCRAYTGSTDIDYTSLVHPVQQTTIGTRFAKDLICSFPSQTIPRTWLFGNEKFILVVCECDLTYVKTFAFGSMEVFNPNENEGNLLLYQAFTSANTSTHYWFNHNTLCVFDTISLQFMFWNTVLTNSFYSWKHTAANGYSSGQFSSYGRAVQRNSLYTVRRPLYKQIFYGLDSGDGRYVPVAKNWVARLDTEGLEIGEQIMYGPTEKWLTFPNGRVNERFKGFAVQIAS